MMTLVLILGLQDADALIRDLGSADIEVREAATGKLIELREQAEPALKKAIGGADLEVRARARTALDTIAIIRDCKLEEVWKKSPRVVRELAAAETREEWIDRLAPFAAVLGPETRKALAGVMLKEASVLQRLWDLGKQSPDGRPEDVWFCRAALESDHGEASQAACLAFETIARSVPAADGPDICRRLASKVAGKDGNASEFAVRAICSLAEAGVLGNAAEPAAGAGLKELTSEDVEQRRRGANLLGGIAAQLESATADAATEGLLKAASRPAGTEREVAAYQMTLRALAAFGGHVKSAKMREALAARYLEALADRDDNDWYFSIRFSALRGMSALAIHLEGETRVKVLRSIISSVSDRSFVYMSTSGVASPYRHQGAEALSAVAPALNEALRKEAFGMLEVVIKGEKDQEVIRALEAARREIEKRR